MIFLSNMNRPGVNLDRSMNSMLVFVLVLLRCGGLEQPDGRRVARARYGGGGRKSERATRRGNARNDWWITVGIHSAFGVLLSPEECLQAFTGRQSGRSG